MHDGAKPTGRMPQPTEAAGDAATRGGVAACLTAACGRAAALGLQAAPGFRAPAPWLRRIATGAPSGWRLYEVAP
jgi:hypothetical protein